MKLTVWQLLLCCGFLALPSHAADADPWLRMKSANFELFTTSGERSGRDLIRHFERVRSFFAQAFKMQGAPARPAVVIAFRSEKEYEPYRPGQVATAFFLGGVAHDFIVMQSTSSEHYPVAVHEYTHLLVRQSEMHVPVWLNEGLAEVFSNLTPQGDKIIVGKLIPGRAQTLLNEKWIPLRTLLAVDHNSPFYNEKSRAGMFYAESWLLVHMFQMSPAYSGRLAAVADAMKEENAGIAAFEKACRKTVEQVEKDLRDYMNSPTMSARLFPVQLPKSVDTPQIETGAALPARLALAEMQLNSAGNRQKSRLAYEELAREFPARWEVEAGLAQFFTRERGYPEAAKHFARAAELGSKDARMFLDYGKLLTYARRDADAIAPKAVELDPTLTEARVELGSAYTRTSRFREALLEFQLVKSITPALAPRYFYSFAYSCYRLNALAEAKVLIERGRPYSKDRGEIAALDRLAEAVETPRVVVEVRQPPPAAPPPDEDDEVIARPRIVRGAEPQEPEPERQPDPSWPVVEGALESIECIGQQARLQVRVSSALKVFVITDPAKVLIRGGEGGAVDFQCGKQTPRTVRVSYQAMPNAAGVAGEVKALDFP